jgi:hypothetical protein
MNDIQRERYAAEYYRLLGELTQLDAMIADYPEPGDDVKDEQAYDDRRPGPPA